MKLTKDKLNQMLKNSEVEHFTESGEPCVRLWLKWNKETEVSIAYDGQLDLSDFNFIDRKKELIEFELSNEQYELLKNKCELIIQAKQDDEELRQSEMDEYKDDYFDRGIKPSDFF